ncbi:hypothetical protein SAMN04489731_103514 [Amycolatopsis regifaucium]|nr:hypothetical protein SAMN04489731_103514 [Amycolatopsis regifaucium]
MRSGDDAGFREFAREKALPVVFVAPGDGPAKVAPAAPTSSALPPQVRPDEHTPLVDLTAQKARNLEHLRKTVMNLLPGATEFTFGEFEQDYYPAEWDVMTASVRYRDASNVERGFNVTLTGVVSTRKEYSDRTACPGGLVVKTPAVRGAAPAGRDAGRDQREGQPRSGSEGDDRRIGQRS